MQALNRNEVELCAPAQRQPGICGWFRANFGVYVCVDRYARFMGSLGGLIMSLILLGVWIGLGYPMGYDNPNWLLIIGTYTGLVGPLFQDPRRTSASITHLVPVMSLISSKRNYIITHLPSSYTRVCKRLICNTYGECSHKLSV